LQYKCESFALKHADRTCGKSGTLPERPGGAASGGQPWHDLEMIAVVRFNLRLAAGAFDTGGVAAGVRLRAWPREV